MLSESVCAMLIEAGRGTRPPRDPYFDGNDTLSEMTERIGLFEIDVSSVSESNFRCHAPGCSAAFESLAHFEAHYNAAHRYSCCECKKTLPSGHLLDLHVAERHDGFFAALAARGPAYRCYVPECTLKFGDAKERMSHCVDEHRFPANFRFDIVPPEKTKSKPKTKTKKKAEQSMEVEEGSPKRVEAFNFGHSQKKSFRPKKPSALNSDQVMAELKASLPAD